MNPFSVLFLMLALSERHVQKHHRSKSENDAHGGEIRLFLLIFLTFGNQLVYGDEDHRACGKGERIRQNALYVHDQGCADYTRNRLDHS